MYVSAANSVAKKVYNWNTLNRAHQSHRQTRTDRQIETKHAHTHVPAPAAAAAVCAVLFLSERVFKKMGFQLESTDVDDVVNAKPYTIEKILRQFQIMVNDMMNDTLIHLIDTLSNRGHSQSAMSEREVASSTSRRVCVLICVHSLMCTVFAWRPGRRWSRPAATCRACHRPCSSSLHRHPSTHRPRTNLVSKVKDTHHPTHDMHPVFVSIRVLCVVRPFSGSPRPLPPHPPGWHSRHAAPAANPCCCTATAAAGQGAGGTTHTWSVTHTHTHTETALHRRGCLLCVRLSMRPRRC